MSVASSIGGDLETECGHLVCHPAAACLIRRVKGNPMQPPFRRPANLAQTFEIVYELFAIKKVQRVDHLY